MRQLILFVGGKIHQDADHFRDVWRGTKIKCAFMIEHFSFAVQKIVVMVDSKVDEIERHAMYLKESI